MIMRKILGLTSLTLALVAGGMLAAQTRKSNPGVLRGDAPQTLVMTSATPADNSTVTSLGNVEVVFSAEIDLNVTTDYVACTVSKDGADYATMQGYLGSEYSTLYLYPQTTIVEEGEYTVTIPAASLKDFAGNGTVNPETVLHYTIGGTSGGSTSGDYITCTSITTPSSQPVSSFSKVALKLDTDSEADTTKPFLLLDESGNQLQSVTNFLTECSDPNVFVYDKLTISFTEVSTPGKYRVSVPEGALTEYQNSSKKNQAFEVEIEVADVGPSFTDVAIGVSPASASTMDVSEFTKVSLSFTDMGLKTAAKTLTFTNDSGDSFDQTLSTGVLAYGMAAISDIAFTKSGTYTLVIPEGTFYDDEYVSSNQTSGKRNAEVTCTWTLTGGTGGDDPTTPVGDFSVTSMTIVNSDASCDLLAANPTLDRWEAGAPLTIEVSNDGVNFIQMDVVRVYEENGEAQEEIVKGMVQMTRNSDNKFVKELPGTLDLTFLNGEKYEFRGKAYDKENPPYERVQLGEFTYTLTGTGQGYQYSPVKLLSVTPEPANDSEGTEGTEITNTREIFVFTFSAPVNVDKAASGVNLGQGAMSSFATLTPNPARTVWMATVSESYLESLRPELQLIIAANDDNGLRLEGNNGIEDKSCSMFTWPCYIGAPTVKVVPEWNPEISTTGVPTDPEKAEYSELTELYEFYAWTPDVAGIMFSWLKAPYLATMSGTKVCDIDLSDGNYEVVYAPGQESNMDAKSIGVRFRLKNRVNGLGNYKLVIPSGAFALGTEFDGAGNKGCEVVYAINGEAKAEGCSIEEGESLSKVSMVAFYVSSDVEIAPLTSMRLQNEEGNVASVTPIVTGGDGKVMILGDFTTANDGKSIQLEEGVDYSIVIPANRVTVAGSEISYPEFRVNFKGAGAAAETVALTHSVSGHASAVSNVIKGESAVINLTPAEGWDVEKVLFNGEDVTGDVADNKYTTPALEAASTVAVEMYYKDATVTPSSVDEVVTDFNVRAWSEDGSIVIAGLTDGTNVEIFTVGGAKIAEFVSADPKYSVAAPADTYIIVLSDGTKRAAIKLLHN